MGLSAGRFCETSKHSSLTSEDDSLLRWEIAEMTDKINQLQETLYVEKCQNFEKAGKKKPKPEKPLAPVNTAKMALPRLQEELGKLEDKYAQLRAEEAKENGVILTRSSLHRPTMEQLGAAGLEVPTNSNFSNEMWLEDHTLLFGQEDEHGLRWDRKWAGSTAGPKDEQTRHRTREGTKNKVVTELGLTHFGEAATAVRGNLPPKRDQTTLFIDESHKQEDAAAAGGTNILGRYDVVCVKVCTDFDREWRFIKSGRNDFWVAHAAALNIGESTMATDFQEFCQQQNNGCASGTLDEERYYEAMGDILSNVIKATTQLGAEHLVLFPFGMGAFLRHLGQLDGNFTDDEQLQRLRRRLAHRFIEVLQSSPKKLHLHLCLGFSCEEPQRNADAFLRALCSVEGSGLVSRLTVWPEGDSLQLAHELAGTSSNVVLLNGANRQLLGNHWFAGRAKLAIDENLHRRSWRLAALSYLLNGFDGKEPSDRQPDELQKNVERIGGHIRRLPA